MAKKIGKGIGILILVLVLLVILFFGFLAVTEFRPDEKEAIPFSSRGSAETQSSVRPGDTLNILTWNIGYGALGETADFFMDGGTHVQTAYTDLVQKNMQNIQDQLLEEKADVIFLQEVDQSSTRSCRIDEVELLRSNLMGYTSNFANNFKVAYLPYPWPPMGKVDSGLLTFHKFKESQAERIQLPIPFKWPVRMVNLKRCLLVNRIPLADSDKELVVINLHLEAYDDGEGKIAQTKMLLELLNAEQEKGNYVIAGGDFNQTFSNVDLTNYPKNPKLWTPGVIDVKDFGSNWTLSMDASQPTCRSLDQPLAGADTGSFQFYVIDGFIVSKNVKVKSLQTKQLHFKHSDHNPVQMEVTLSK